jgi:hypothetical protein
MAKAAHATRKMMAAMPGGRLDELHAALAASSLLGLITALPFASSSRLGNDEGADEGESDDDREVVVVTAAAASVSVDPPAIAGAVSSCKALSL